MNFSVAALSADSDSVFRERDTFTAENSTSPSSSSICAASPDEIASLSSSVSLSSASRIRRAAELIVYSDHSLSQVSEMCGFASVSHFNRVFLKYAGITPGQCRRAYPADILFGHGPSKKDVSSQSERFIYNVLAQKRITPDMLNQLDAPQKDE